MKSKPAVVIYFPDYKTGFVAVVVVIYLLNCVDSRTERRGNESKLPIIAPARFGCLENNIE